jgi:hypothetical protein
MIFTLSLRVNGVIRIEVRKVMTFANASTLHTVAPDTRAKRNGNVNQTSEYKIVNELRFKKYNGPLRVMLI